MSDLAVGEWDLHIDRMVRARVFSEVGLTRYWVYEIRDPQLPFASLSGVRHTWQSAMDSASEALKAKS